MLAINEGAVAELYLLTSYCRDHRLHCMTGVLYNFKVNRFVLYLNIYLYNLLFCVINTQTVDQD